jgi:hypothetical protein
MLRLLATLWIAQFVTTAQPLFRNTSAQVRYAGSKSCLPCHKAIYQSFVKTAMGRSVTKPGRELLAGPVRIISARFNREYQVVESGGELYQTESQAENGQTIFETRHKLEYAIGSGENGISFAVRRGNHLFQRRYHTTRRRGVGISHQGMKKPERIQPADLRGASYATPDVRRRCRGRDFIAILRLRNSLLAARTATARAVAYR